MGREVFETRGLQGREALVEAIKVKAGELDDLLVQVAEDRVSESGFVSSRSQQCHRMVAVARTNLEQAVMWAVKAVSRSRFE